MNKIEVLLSVRENHLATNETNPLILKLISGLPAMPEHQFTGAQTVTNYHAAKDKAKGWHKRLYLNFQAKDPQEIYRGFSQAGFNVVDSRVEPLK